MAETVAEAFVTLRPDMSQFKGGVTSFFKTGGFAIAAAAAAAVGGVTALVMPAAEVEQQLDVLQATSNATGEQMKQLSELAKTLGADLTLPGTSSKDAAEAMVELAKGGLSVNEIFGASKGVLQLAAAGQLSNAAAAEITANALNVFGLAGTEAVRVADLLAGAANAASGTVLDMADALQMSAAVFGAANVPIEDLVTEISLLAKAGIQGSDAGTSLKSFMLQLQTPTKAAAKLMREMGFSVYDASGTMKSQRDIIANLVKSTKDMTQAQRESTLGQIFGSDAIRAANVLTRAGVEGFDALKGAVTRQGAAAMLAGALNKGLLGAIDGFKSAVSTAAIDIGTKMLPMLTEFGRNAAELVNGLHTMGPALAILWEGIVGGFDMVKAALQSFWDLVTIATPVMIVAIAAVGTAIWLAFGPVGVAALAIAGMAAILIGFHTDWDALFAALPPPVQLALASVLESVQGWAGALNTVFNTVIDGINTVANAFIASAKVIAFGMAGMAMARGDFKEAESLIRRGNELSFNPVENINLPAEVNDAITRLRQQAETTTNIAASDAFEAAAAAAWNANVGPMDIDPLMVSPEAPVRDSHDLTVNVQLTGMIGAGGLEDPRGITDQLTDAIVTARDRASLAEAR